MYLPSCGQRALKDFSYHLEDVPGATELYSYVDGEGFRLVENDSYLLALPSPPTRLEVNPIAQEYLSYYHRRVVTEAPLDPLSPPRPPFVPMQSLNSHNPPPLLVPKGMEVDMPTQMGSVEQRWVEQHGQQPKEEGMPRSSTPTGVRKGKVRVPRLLPLSPSDLEGDVPPPARGSPKRPLTPEGEGDLREREVMPRKVKIVTPPSMETDDTEVRGDWEDPLQREPAERPSHSPSLPRRRGQLGHSTSVKPFGVLWGYL